MNTVNFETYDKPYSETKCSKKVNKLFIVTRIKYAGRSFRL